jgi:hypothetical protein
VPPAPSGDRGQGDSFVKVCRAGRFGLRCQQSDEPRRTAELGRARRTHAEMLRQPSAPPLGELIQQVRVDQRASGVAVHRIGRGGLAHTLYMTRGGQKVAGHPIRRRELSGEQTAS